MIHRRFLTVLRLDPAKRRQLIEASTLFHGARAALRVIPFRRLAALLGTPTPPPGGVRFGEDVDLEAVHAVRRAVRWAARNHPDTCLAQALAGRVMLRRRGIGSVLYFGVRHDEARAMKFHAWLRHGRVVVTGEEGHRAFTVLSTLYDARVPAAAPAA